LDFVEKIFKAVFLLGHLFSQFLPVVLSAERLLLGVDDIIETIGDLLFFLG
jgi:hypothetical protein